MAFKRFAKKTYRKGRKAYRFAKKHQSEAKEALALAKKVARMVNVEYKFRDNPYATTVSNTGTIQNLCQPPQGDGDQNRDGSSVKLARCSGRISVDLHPSATSTHVRFILFRGKQENRTAYTLSGGILEGGPSALWQSPKAWEDRFRTKFIYDKTICLSNTGRKTIDLNWNFKLYGHIQFGGGTTDIESGGIYLAMISDESVNTPTVNYALRVTFTDN